MNDDQLKDLLDSAAPDQPRLTPGERAAAVATRGRAVRRRNRFVLVAAVAAVVGAGVAVPLTIDGGGTARDKVGVAAESEAADLVVEPEPCPKDPIVTSELAPVAELPDGAVSARVCPAIDAGQVGTTDTLPTAPLTDGADDLVAAIRDLPRVTSLREDCAFMSVAPDPWALVVAYDDTTVVIGSTARVCSLVTVGGADRAVEDVLAAIVAAEPASGEPAPCPPPSDGLRSLEAQPDTFTGTPADFVPVAGTLCYGVDPMGGPEYAGTEAVLGRAALQQLVDSSGREMTAEPSVEGVCADAGPTRLLVLVDERGGRVTYVDTACTGEFATPWGWWRPSEADEQLIAESLGGRVGG